MEKSLALSLPSPLPLPEDNSIPPGVSLALVASPPQRPRNLRAEASSAVRSRPNAAPALEPFLTSSPGQSDVFLSLLP